MHVFSHYFQAGDRLVRFRLVYAQALHEPAILLRCKCSCLTLFSWPLKAAGFQAFVQEDKAVSFPVQRLDPVPASSTEQK